ncbi:MAG TPA: hypothetical protein VMV86_07120, partial [Methanosarcinales archaeon]|nr:hypothetical protein [Methanosarcinales archaeon]
SQATLLSLRDTPVMPAGYDLIRRIGYAITHTGGSSFMLLNQAGVANDRTYFYDEPVNVLTAGTSATFADIDLSVAVPSVDNMKVCLEGLFTPNAASDTANFRSGGSSATTGYVLSGATATKVSSEQMSIVSKLVVGVPTVQYKVAASGSLGVNVVNFTDTL